MKRVIYYAVVVGLGFLAIASAAVSDWSEYTKVLVTTPGVAALAGALFQLLRDNLAHERQLILRQREEVFGAGFASHMAEVTFDKHVGFCEEYVKKSGSILRELWGQGPSKQCLSYAQDLSEIRMKHVLWITPEVAKLLKEFESVLSSLGASAAISSDMPVGEERSKNIHKMYAGWQDLIGVKKHGDDNKKEELSVLEVIAWLQSVLGVEELTTLRKKILEEAIKN